MPTIRVPYGRSEEAAQVPDDIPVDVIDHGRDVPKAPPPHLLEDAMDNPIGTDRLENLVSPKDKVSIVVNDHTRPGPNIEIMQALVRRLESAGVPDDHVTVVFATGSHRQPTASEMEQIIGSEYCQRFRLVPHDCRDTSSLVTLGVTKSGLPVCINRAVAESTFCILTGLIAPHQSAGYSGGRKSIVPGVAGLECLRVHHSFPIRPYDPVMGWMEGNPFHETALEAARLAPVKFIVNAVQAPSKAYIAFVAGELDAAHAAGVAICREVSETKIGKPADIIVASPGGYPRDRDLYQAQKALSVAELLGTSNCTFILVAECVDGIGNQTFQDWMIEGKSPRDILKRFAETGFNAGNNKAFNYARALTKGRIIIVTRELDPALLTRMMLESAPDLESALRMAMERKKPNRILVLPKAVNIVPILDN
ncbi:MAG: nickel-dependent lactate racemase [Bacillota bacterium]|jgi:nickel-dependent lactate racemase